MEVHWKIQSLRGRVKKNKKQGTEGGVGVFEGGWYHDARYV